MRLSLDKPFTGDVDELVKRRAIRVGVTSNRMHYFIDQGQEHGLTYEALKAFDNDLNTDLKVGNLKVHVAIVPMSRDQLQPALLNGGSTWSRPWSPSGPLLSQGPYLDFRRSGYGSRRTCGRRNSQALPVSIRISWC